MLESQVVVGGVVGEQHAVVEGVLAAQVVAEHDVRQFMREHSGQAGLVGKNVDQAAADDDSVAHAEGFERRGEQHARANRTRQIDVVRDFEIVDHGLENFVDIAFGREQAGARKALDDVVFRLLLPFALGLQRRSILRGRRFRPSRCPPGSA